MDKAILTIDGKRFEFPVISGTYGEKAIDLSSLRETTGMMTYDPGLGNTAICISHITYMDPNGILRYRGYPIAQLAKESSFVEAAYLLIHGNLPASDTLTQFSAYLTENSLIPEDMKRFFQNFPSRTNPIRILSTMVNALRSFYPPLDDLEEEINITVARLLSQIRTLAAMSYKISRGHSVVYPKGNLSYCANFLNMMFDSPVQPYTIDDTMVRALNSFLILHADHEQNVSTSIVRTVGGGRINLYEAVSAGISALWSHLHGGLNVYVSTLLSKLIKTGISAQKVVENCKNETDIFRRVCLGHRVYKPYDPRAILMKEIFHHLLEEYEPQNSRIRFALQIEKELTKDAYFNDHHLFLNFEFYSEMALTAMGIPIHMQTVMMAIGRLPGWIAQWVENTSDPNWRLNRPRQIYAGLKERKYIPLHQR